MTDRALNQFGLVRILMQPCRDSLIAAVGMAVDGSRPLPHRFLRGVTRIALFVPIFALLAGCGSPSSPGQPADGAQAGDSLSPVRIGVVHMWRGETEAPVVVGLRQGFKDLGYVEGKDLILEVRAGKGSYDLALEGARQLVKDRVDVLVSAGTKSTQAAHTAVDEASYSLPIVFTQVGKPVKAGFV